MDIRTKNSALHFLASSCIALLAGLLVFAIWYPPPYATIAGGLTLFAMLAGIDVVLGPCLTAIVSSPTKPRRELRVDIGLIVVVQLIALGYGLYTIAQARPVFLVFEVDRFRVVSAADLDPAALEKAPPEYRRLPWTGPVLIAAKKSETPEEMARSLDLSLQGVDISMQPNHWTSYASSVKAVLEKSLPVKALIEKYPDINDEVRQLATQNGILPEEIRFLPLQSRNMTGTVLISIPNARIIGHLAIDGFI